MSIFQYLSTGGGVPLGKPRPNQEEMNEQTKLSPYSFYQSKLKYFNNYSYALTISSKETPRMKGKTVKQQYDILCHFLKTTFIDCNYLFFFELYKCGEYLHCHGFVKINKVSQVPKLKQSMYLYMMLKPLAKRESYKPLIDFNKINDIEAWTKYCFKDLSVMLLYGCPPTFKLTETSNSILYV